MKISSYQTSTALTAQQEKDLLNLLPLESPTENYSALYQSLHLFDKDSQKVLRKSLQKNIKSFVKNVNDFQIKDLELTHIKGQNIGVYAGKYFKGRSEKIIPCTGKIKTETPKAKVKTETSKAKVEVKPIQVEATETV